ncbi:MAG: hypothetical protein KDA85_05265 [Planctomycetaceae bacterium]|nr:hypothetical protein [Planctomycetaceae bacterium]
MTATISNTTHPSATAIGQTVEVPCCVLLPSCAIVPGQVLPVTGGLCLPQGACHEIGHAELVNQSVLSAGSLPVQAEVLNRWSDGSIRWLLASLLVPSSWQQKPEQSIPCQLMLKQRTSRTTTDVTMVGTPWQATVRADGQRISLRRSDLTAVPATEHELQLAIDLRVGDRSVPVMLRPLETELSGDIRQVIVTEGVVADAPWIHIRLRFTTWTTTGLLQADLTIHNSRRARHRQGLWDLGDAGAWSFESLSLVVINDGQPARVHWKVDPQDVAREEPPGSSVLIQQHSSGGRNWQATTHVNASGSVPYSVRGYTARSAAGTLRGHRCQPMVSHVSDQQLLSVTIPEFWQQFPASLSADGAQIHAGLFPAHQDQYELQGGERKTKTVMIQACSSRPNVDLHQLSQSPARVFQPPAWYADCQVFPWFRPLHEWHAMATAEQTSATITDGDIARLSRYLQQATSGETSMDARRESIDEYGWRNFGDLPADHEQPWYKGPGTVVSHYNNQFDLIFGGILNLAATGDPRWFSLFDPLARHVMDIDIYHTTEDRAAFSGGLFWHTDHFVDAGTCTHRTYTIRNCPPAGAYGGGPSNEHNYTTGLLHYYFLTGHPDARDAVISLADWVIAMDDGRNTVFGLLDDQPTGMASCTVDPEFHGPGRGGGNSVNALLDAWLLTEDLQYRNYAEELIRRCVHPEQNPDELNLNDAEKRWSYTVFLTAMGRYLEICDKANDRGPMYAWVRTTLAMYGRWMAEQEGRTLDHPERLELPSEAWAAQDFRKANVLRIAAQCEDDPEKAARMRVRADEINDAAWRDLYNWGQQHLTSRCLSILMTEGLRDVFHRTEPARTLPVPQVSLAIDPWIMFVSQKTRVKLLLRAPHKLLLKLPRLCRPSLWWQALRALRRQLT